jgi:hypothetical protein
VIDDLDRTIEALLRAHLPASLAGQLAISFLAPDSDFPPSSVPPPALDLFLYDLREDRDLRSTEWIVDEESGTRRPPPLRLACSYLVTAWAAPGSADVVREEHRLLGEVVRVLVRHRTIPADLLAGVLAEQPLPPPATSLQAGPLPSVGEFWQAAGRPKAALAYTVTLAVDAVPALAAGPPVQEPVVDVRIR